MASNPFSTRFIRPGAIPFLFVDGESATSLIKKLREQHWWGQIIGPHGSGKSTLLETLKPELEAAGRQIVAITLHQGEHRLPSLVARSLTTTTQLVIDGYEQLSWWSRWRVKWRCWWCGAGLLVTVHTDARLPTIYRTNAREELVRAIVGRLLGNGESLISSADITAAYDATGGDIRETLFKLYDVYQAQEQRAS